MRKAASGELVANACTQSSILQKPKIARKQFACFNKTALLKKKTYIYRKGHAAKKLCELEISFSYSQLQVSAFFKTKKKSQSMTNLPMKFSKILNDEQFH